MVQWYAQPFVHADDSLADKAMAPAIAISDSYAFVGVPWEENGHIGVDTNAWATGVTYILKNDHAGHWQETQQITASDKGPLNFFGCAVALANEWAVIGAKLKTIPNAQEQKIIGAGGAYVFHLDATGAWKETSKLEDPTAAATPWQCFGHGVAIAGSFIAVSAPYKDCVSSQGDTILGAGQVFIYQFDGLDNWEIKQIIEPPVLQRHGSFGSSLAMENNLLLIGAPGATPKNKGNDSLQRNTGTAYVFTRNPSSNGWELQAELAASDGQAGDQFGLAVAVNEGVLAIGAPPKKHHSYARGSVYVFKPSRSGDWVTEKTINGDGDFGSSIALVKDLMVIGSPRGGKDGLSYLFHTAKRHYEIGADTLRTPQGAQSRFFGSTVATNGEAVVVSQYQSYTHFYEKENSVGLVYLFTPVKKGE